MWSILPSDRRQTHPHTHIHPHTHPHTHTPTHTLPSDRRQTTDDRRQTTDDRRQTTDDRRYLDPHHYQYTDIGGRQDSVQYPCEICKFETYVNWIKRTMNTVICHVSYWRIEVEVKSEKKSLFYLPSIRRIAASAASLRLQAITQAGLQQRWSKKSKAL
jgi:hypothetical protein